MHYCFRIIQVSTLLWLQEIYIIDACVEHVKYYLKHEHECFIRYKTRGAAERFISDKALMLVF